MSSIFVRRNPKFKSIYEPKKDSWFEHLVNLKTYFLAHNITSEVEKRKILLNSLSRNGFVLLTLLLDDHDVHKYSFDLIVDMFNDNCRKQQVGWR